MPQQIEIISKALVLIGANSISSLSEGTEGEVAALLYEEAYLGLLSSHNWRFATKKQQLSRLTEVPVNEFSYMYQLPSDLVTVVKVQDGTDYEIYGDKLYSDQPEVYIDYRVRVDELLLPPHFVLALQFLLASEFAIPITDNSQRAQVYNGMYEAQLRRAKYIDSSEHPNDAIAHQPLVEAMQ